MSVTADPEDRALGYFSRAVGQCARSISPDIGEFRGSVPGSPFMTDIGNCATFDHRQKHPRKLLLTWMVRQCSHTHAKLSDHRNERTVNRAYNKLGMYSPWSIVRVAAEAAARCAYLMEVGISLEERLLRAAGTKLESDWREIMAHRESDASDVANQLQGSGYAPKTPELEKRYAKNIAWLSDRLGLQVKPGYMDVPTFFAWPGSNPSRLKSPTRMVADYLPGYPTLYAVGSGAIHSSGWVLDDLVTMPPEDPGVLRYRADVGESGAVALAAIGTAVLAVKSAGAYYGYATSDKESAYRTREIAVEQALGVFRSSGWTPPARRGNRE